MSTTTVDLTRQGGFVGRILRYSDLSVAIAVIAVVVMMILPLPHVLLDIFITCNITVALLLVIVSMYTKDALELSSFPSILLFTTLFRLAINISVTRLILVDGNAGNVIKAFGNFVVGGNVVVGLVIFLIIVVVQFMVITAGAGRVAEVAARFTLDAMPGKQMAIDADLNAGQITDAQARERREKIQREADFHGAMDGASKFVKGDAVAGVIIVFVNIIAGMAIGVVQGGMQFSEALHTYTLMTVGDGIAAQIPALLISTATGLLVTRTAGAPNLGLELSGQLLARPRPLLIVAGVLGALGLVPGLPKIPFFVIAIIVGTVGWSLRKTAVEEVRKEEERERAAAAKPKQELASPDSVRNALMLDVLELEIGYGLIPLVDEAEGGELLRRVALVRRQMAAELGLVLSPIRIRDNVQLSSHAYAVKLKGSEIARNELQPGSLLAMNPGDADPSLEGTATTEPAFGLPALWIAEAARARAESYGYTVVDPASVIITHLTEVIRRHADELCSRQDTKLLLDGLREQHPAPVDELVPDLLQVGEVHRVLCGLLVEGVSVRDIVTIVETLGDKARITKDPGLLTEYCRQALARQITGGLVGPAGELPVLTLEPQLEMSVAEAVIQTPDGAYLGLDPGQAHQLNTQIKDQLERASTLGLRPALLCSAKVRRHLKALTIHTAPRLPVLSYNEIVPSVHVETVGVVGA